MHEMSEPNTVGRRPPRIFLSYASEDKDVARKITDRLRHNGVQIWFDEYELQTGDSIRNRIQDAIAASDYLVVLLSPNSVRAHWLQSELNSAFSRELTSRDIAILPVLIADCEIPSTLAGRIYLDLRKNFDQGIERLTQRMSIAPDIDFSRLDARSFENLIVEILECQGFSEIQREHSMADKVYDIRANYISTDPFGAEKEEIWIAEVKFYRNARADLNAIHQMVSYIERLPGHYKGLIITNGQLTSAARDWLASAENEHRIEVRIVDGTELKRLLLNNPQLVHRYFHIDTKP